MGDGVFVGTVYGAIHKCIIITRVGTCSQSPFCGFAVHKFILKPSNTLIAEVMVNNNSYSQLSTPQKHKQTSVFASP